MATKPTKLAKGFGLDAETTKQIADQQQSLMAPVENGMHEVRIRTASVFTKGEDGTEHEYPALGLMFDFDAYPGQRGVCYLQFRPKEGGTEEEIGIAFGKFGKKMSALFGATGVDYGKTMNDKEWSKEERAEGRKAIEDMKGVHVRMTVEYNSFMHPRDGVSRGYHLKFITKMEQPTIEA